MTPESTLIYGAFVFGALAILFAYLSLTGQFMGPPDDE